MRIGEVETDELFRKLGEATLALEAASQASDSASREETAARNTLNEAQRNIDKFLAQLKKEQPRDTDWTRKPGVPAGVDL